MLHAMYHTTPCRMPCHTSDSRVVSFCPVLLRAAAKRECVCVFTLCSSPPSCCCHHSCLPVQTAVLVGSGFYCLRGYDLKGDPAGSGDAETPVQTAATELTGMTPSTCGSACRSTTGCQYMLIKRPPAPGGTATCYLKMHALGGLYGNTGPSADVDLTCFNGQDTWLAFGGQLDHALPSPEVNIIAGVPSLASIAPIGLNANASGSQETYRCIKGYAVDGALLEQVAVPLGDEGLMQCAAKCNAAKPRGACVGYVMAVDGSCSMFGSIAVRVRWLRHGLHCAAAPCQAVACRTTNQFENGHTCGASSLSLRPQPCLHISPFPLLNCRTVQHLGG